MRFAVHVLQTLTIVRFQVLRNEPPVCLLQRFVAFEHELCCPGCHQIIEQTLQAQRPGNLVRQIPGNIQPGTEPGLDGSVKERVSRAVALAFKVHPTLPCPTQGGDRTPSTCDITGRNHRGGHVVGLRLRFVDEDVRTGRDQRIHSLNSNRGPGQPASERHATSIGGRRNRPHRPFPPIVSVQGLTRCCSNGAFSGHLVGQGNRAPRGQQRRGHPRACLAVHWTTGLRASHSVVVRRFHPGGRRVTRRWRPADLTS